MLRPWRDWISSLEAFNGFGFSYFTCQCLFTFQLPCLGLEETESGVWQLLMAVAVHSSAVAFCIGSELVAKGLLKYFYCYPNHTLNALKTAFCENSSGNSPCTEFFSGASKKSVVLYIGILRYNITHFLCYTTITVLSNKNPGFGRLWWQRSFIWQCYIAFWIIKDTKMLPVKKLLAMLGFIWVLPLYIEQFTFNP